MPLTDGLASLEINYMIKPVEPRVLEYLHGFRNEIIDLYSNNLHYADSPYKLSEREFGKSRSDGIYIGRPKKVQYLEDSIENNTLYISLKSLGMSEDIIPHGKDYTWWDTVHISPDLERDQQVRGYTLVDLSLYFIHLQNILAPNRALISNLQATNILRDALGRENIGPAIQAVAKVVLKSLGQTKDSFSDADERAEDILTLLKLDQLAGVKVQAAPGIDFERACRDILIEGGYEVQTTPTSGDYGADLIAHKDGLGFAIQCKDTSRPVGLKAVQEAAGARRHYRADFAVVCCTGGFTEAAIELAVSNGVLLCNETQLVKRLDSV